MNTFDLISSFVGLVASIVSSVFLYMSFRHGPEVYRKPLILFLFGLVLMAVGFSLSIMQSMLGLQAAFPLNLHHLFMALSVFLFVGAAQKFFSVGQ